jgi:hypothetical protein
MKKIALLTLLTISSFTVFAQAKKKSPIDGRIYAITLTEEGKKKAEPIKDDMTFVAVGKFKTNYMVQAQFPQSEYEYEVDSTTSPVSIKFTVEAKDSDNGRFSWEGVIEGDNVTGTAIIRKKGKIVHSYTFAGTQKNKKKAKPAPKAAAPAAVDSTKVAEPLKTE